MSRGRLRIYLGAAPGVGKTYAMLGEGRRRHERGTDVVVAFVETHGREHTAAQLAGLPLLPRARLQHRGSTFEEMDLDAVLARAPEVALVDELAHTNVTGSRNRKRWQDVEELLDAGIDVISTVNVQHLESINDVVESITGIRQRETVPDEVVRSADQIELVDMTPEALRRRMAHGNIYAADKVDAALANYFRPGNLGALRELALLWVADRVDEALQAYRSAHEISGAWETRERIVVAVTGAPSGDHLIRRAARMAERSRGDLLGIHIRAGDGRAGPPSRLLEPHRQLLADLGGEYHELVADDVVAALVDFAHDENATQLVLGTSRRSRLEELRRGSVINQVIRRAGDLDVHVISATDDPTTASTPSAPARARPALSLSVRRRQLGWLLAVGGTGALTALLASTRGTFDQGSQLLLFQAVVLLSAAAGGAAPALTAAVLASAALNWYFTPPQYTWTVDDPENLLALVLFAVVGALVGLLVTAFARRSAAADRAQAEAEALARIAASIATSADPIRPMLERIRRTLDLQGLAVTTDAGEVVAAVGELPAGSTRRIDLVGGRVEIAGELADGDRRILDALIAQLATVLDRRALRDEAERADALAAADVLRTAILRAVSHDLRSPLASIKASVSSLLQEDMRWSAEAEAEFLATIDEEVDRLDTVIGNLLDASRLEAGVIRPATRAVALEEVVPAALASISGLDTPVEVEISPDLPLVRADPGLLERAVANLVANAAAVTERGGSVRVAASRHGGVVQLRVVDRGPGVPADQREQMFQPFQRLGDTAAGSGVGLGLAVSRGIVDALGGSLEVEDTPGGGLTMVIDLPEAVDGT
jgi:two-component system sensor histidine kinase KdpD